MDHMEVMQRGEGFWRWTAPHPEWTPAEERPGRRVPSVGRPYPQMLSGALQAHSIAGLECRGETVFFVPQHRALVCADALIGAGNGLIRVPPIRWAENTPQGQELYRKEFRASLGKLNGLEIDMVLVSHGEPVLTDGSAALAEALAAPAWCEN